MISIRANDQLAVAVTAAIRSGDVESLQQYLRRNPDLARVRIVDHRGVSRTLLHVATDWPGHFPNVASIVTTLLRAGSDVNGRVLDSEGSSETALHWAASSDDVAALDALLDGGADIEASGAVFTGGSAMSDAVVFGQWRAAHRLLQRGATTTIWQAAAMGLVDRVRLLCSGEVPPTPEEITNAFWHACRNGHQPPAEYLLSRGADYNWVGYDGETPMDVAQEGGYGHLIQWLRSLGGRRRTENE